MNDRPEMQTQVSRQTVRQLAANSRDGGLRLPAYQRPLVWTPEQALALVESVYEGYPIGAFLVWAPSWAEGILLDGQQRLAALTGRRCGTDTLGPQIGWSFLSGKWCLDPSDPNDDWLSLLWWFETEPYDRVTHLLALQEKYEPGDKPNKKGPWGNAIYAFDRLESAVGSIILLERATAAQAAEAFRRINTSGTPIDTDELARLLAAEEVAAQGGA
jgi:hypothetical protein